MSGGHFDYYQYHIDDIIASIEREIERATCERPPIVRELRVCVSEYVEGDFGHYYRPHWQGFLSVEQAEKYFVDLGYVVTERGDSVVLMRDVVTGDEIKISSYMDEHYEAGEDGEIPYFPDFTEETIQEFRNAIGVLKRARVYAQRVDWLLSGDDSEESFHKRLKEELEELDKEEKNGKECEE